MLLIFAPRQSERLSYITNLVFNRIMGVECLVTTAFPEYQRFTGPKFAYTHAAPEEGLFLDAHPLLWEPGIGNQNMTMGLYEGIPVFFRSSHPRSILPFDILAAAFYLVSRYEEYLPHQKDLHGRYQFSESLAYRGNFLGMPVVNLWVKKMERLLIAAFPELKPDPPPYRFIPTIDVDHAWCYLGRPWWRNAGGIGRSLLKMDFGEIFRRIRVLSGAKTDPFDTFAFIEECHHDNPALPLFFILHADYGGNDNNVTVTAPAFKTLIRSLDKVSRVGIHPSLSSGRQKEVLHSEITALSEILDRKISISRQHFLRFCVPDTFRLLNMEGITDDFSMGYPDNPGFRAGIASPFPFFDLRESRSTGLMLHPVTFMDVTFRDKLRLTPRQALETMESFILTVKEVGGELVTIWHNESLSGHGRWAGWEQVYPEMVRMATNR